MEPLEVRRNDFLNLLAKTRYYIGDKDAASFDWLFGIGEASKLVELLCSYVDSSNILQEEELRDFEDLVDEVLHGDELDDALRNVGVEEIDIDTVRQQIAYMKEEFQEADIELYYRLEDQLSEECEEMATSIAQLKENQNTAGRNLLETAGICFELANKLDSERDILARSFNDVACSLEAFRDRAPQKLLLELLPFDEYQELCDKFFEYVQDYIEQQFEEKTENKSHTNCPYLHLLKGPNQADLMKRKEETNRLQQCITLELFGNVLESADEKDMDHLMLYIEKLRDDINLKLPMDILSFETEVEILRSLEADVEQLMKQIKEECMQVAHLKILKTVVSPACHLKKCRQQYWLQKISDLSDCVEEHLIHKCILKLLINRERFLLTAMIDVITNCCQEFEGEYHSYETRESSMRAQGENYVLFQKRSSNLHLHLKESVCDMMACSSIESALLNLNSVIRKKEELLFGTKFLQSQQKIIMQRKKNIKDLEKVIFSGPTRKLIEFNSFQFSLYNDCGLIIDVSEKVLEENKNQIQNVNLVLKNKPFHKHKRLLWVYFLMNCGMLQLVTSDIHNTLNKRISLGSSTVGSSADAAWKFLFSLP